MASINIDDAQVRLRQLITDMNPGEPLTITQNGVPLATLAKVPLQSWPCKAGSAKDTPHWMAPDFDAPLDDFKEYTE